MIFKKNKFNKKVKKTTERESEKQQRRDIESVKQIQHANFI